MKIRRQVITHSSVGIGMFTKYKNTGNLFNTYNLVDGDGNYTYFDLYDKERVGLKIWDG